MPEIVLETSAPRANQSNECVKTALSHHEAKSGLWDLFFLNRAALTNTPAFLRAWTTILAFAIVLLFAACIIFSFAILWRLAWDSIQLPNPLYQEATRNFFLAFAAIFGAPFLVWRAIVAHQQAAAATEQARVSLENHFTGIFAKSVELLGAEREKTKIDAEGKSTSHSAPNTESRLGALYSLERLLNESFKDQRAILETLCAYVRENSPLDIPTDEQEERAFFRGEYPPSPSRRTDVQAAITIIGRRSREVIDRAIIERWQLDLRRTNLVAYDFSSLNFDQSDFSGSFLNGAIMSDSSFANSKFERTFLRTAKLDRADFRSCQLTHTDLSYAKVEGTDFNNATFNQTDLRRSSVTSFTIEGADLEHAFGDFLRYAIESVQKNGINDVNAQEIFSVVELLQKAKHNDETRFSKATIDALALASN